MKAEDRGDHKDYHQWNDNEDRSYRRWYEENHRGKDYRDYNRLNRRDQQAYWNWRHQNGDNDDRTRKQPERTDEPKGNNSGLLLLIPLTALDAHNSDT